MVSFPWLVEREQLQYQKWFLSPHEAAAPARWSDRTPCPVATPCDHKAAPSLLQPLLSPAPGGKPVPEHFWPSSCPSCARQPSRILRPSAALVSAPGVPILPSVLQAAPKESRAEHQAGKSGSFPKLQAVFSAGWSCCTSHTVLMSRVWGRDRFWRWALTMCKRLPCSVNLDQVNSCSRAQVMGTSTNR